MRTCCAWDGRESPLWWRWIVGPPEGVGARVEQRPLYVYVRRRRRDGRGAGGRGFGRCFVVVVARGSAVFLDAKICESHACEGRRVCFT